MQFTFNKPQEPPKFLTPIPEGSLAWLAWEDLKTYRGQPSRQIGTFSKAIKIAKDARENSPGTLHPHLAYTLSETFLKLSMRLHPSELQRLNVNEAFLRL